MTQQQEYIQIIFIEKEKCELVYLFRKNKLFVHRKETAEREEEHN